MTINVHVQRIMPVSMAMRPVVVELDKLGVTMAQALEPGQFSAKQTKVGAGTLVLLRASEGWCWALIRDLDANGCWVLEREGAPASIPLVDEVPTRSRRAAA
jgi:hypothetical protein